MSDIISDKVPSNEHMTAMLARRQECGMIDPFWFLVGCVIGCVIGCCSSKAVEWRRKWRAMTARETTEAA